MYNLSEYFDFTRINDKDYCESKDLIVKKIHNLHLLKYKKNRLNSDNTETLGLFRSVIVDNDRVVCFAPPKSLALNQFDDWSKLEDDKYVSQPYIEGTMINMFWSPEIDDWEISTRSNIGANCYFDKDEKTTFRTMFLDAMLFCDLEFEHFNKNFIYSFVMQHPKNVRVVPVNRAFVYLVNIYQLVNNYCVTTVITDGGEHGDWHKFRNITIPTIVPDVSSYKAYMNQMNDIIDSNYNYVYPGYVIKTQDSMRRLKITNPSYEYVKNLKGNSTKNQYRYYVLRQEGKVGEYLKYFPKFKFQFQKFRKDLHHFTNELYSSYVSCYILKERELKYFPKRYKTNMFNMHQLYLQSLPSNKDKVTIRKTIEYVNTMDPALLMYCMNSDFNQNEINKACIAAEQ